MATKAPRYTPEEVHGIVKAAELGAAYSRAVKAREAVLDEIGAYLKATKRRRPAPAMMYQYIGFNERDFRKLNERLERAYVVEEQAQHAWLHSDKVVRGCRDCVQPTASAAS